MIETTPILEINRKALISFLAAALALLALCVGFLPVPFTVIICYPPGIVLGIVSLVFGILGLREIHAGGKRGRRLALVAIWLGGFMLLASICMIMAGILLLPRFMDVAQPLWNQLRP